MKVLSRCTALASVLLALICLSASASPAVGGNKEPVYRPHWKPELLAIAKLPTAVGRAFSEGVDSIAYRGNAEQFQLFFDACLALGKTATTTLHFHRGKGTFRGDPKGSQAVPCDWQLDVVYDSSGDHPNYNLEVHLWVDAGVKLRKVTIPLKLYEEAVRHE